MDMISTMQAIHRAAKRCDVHALRGQLLAGVSPDLVKEGCGRVALHFVCMHAPGVRQTECLNLLIEYGASVLARDSRGNSSLHFAYVHDNAPQSPLVRKLIELGCDVNARGYCDRVPLHVAIPRANSHMVSLLLSAGADVNARDVNGMTPLHLSFNYAAQLPPPGVDRIYPIILRAGAEIPAETDHPYLQKVIAAGGWANYERLHLDRLTAMLTPKPTPNDGRRRSRRRLSPLRRVPPEVLRKIAAFAFHAGFY